MSSAPDDLVDDTAVEEVRDCYGSVESFLDELGIREGAVRLEQGDQIEDLEDLESEPVVFEDSFLTDYDDPLEVSKYLEEEKTDFVVPLYLFGSPLSAPRTSHESKGFWVSGYGKVLYVSQNYSK